MADNAKVLSALQAYADRVVLKRQVSKLFERSVLLGLMASDRAMSAVGNRDLRPGSTLLLGGRNVVSRARRMELGGSETIYIPGVRTGKVGGTKNLGYRDTVPTVANPTTNTAVDKLKRPLVRATLTDTPILIWNNDLRAANNRFALASPMTDSIETAAEEAIRSGKERLDLMSFGDDLVLPLVSMTQSARRRMPQPAAG